MHFTCHFLENVYKFFVACFSSTMFLCCLGTRKKTMSSCDEKTKKAEAEWKTNDVFSDYTFVRLIENGGNSDVWEAKQTSTGKTVAIKISLPTKVSRIAMMKEFEMMQKFDSPYVATASIFYSNSSLSTFMIMKRYTSDLYKEAVSQKFDDAKIRRLIRDIAIGIKTIHDSGYVHRDVKPENIFVDDEHNFVLGDFGLSEHEDRLTIAKPIGTTSYISPEVVECLFRPSLGTFLLGKPMDMYALGLTVYACLTQKVVIPSSKTIRDLVKNNVDIDTSYLVEELDIGADLKDLLHGLLHPDPVARLTADEVLEKTREWKSSKP